MTFNQKTHTAISISALESMESMVKRLQEERDALLAQMRNISEIKNLEWGGDYEEIDGARLIANTAIAECTESTKVMQ